MQIIVDKPWRQKINSYIEEHKLRVAHFRYFDDYGEYSNYGGMTIVWRHRSREKLVTIATAICNESDNFCRNTGRVLATQKFIDGQVIQLPVRNYISAWHMISNLFGDLERS